MDPVGQAPITPTIATEPPPFTDRQKRVMVKLTQTVAKINFEVLVMVKMNEKSDPKLFVETFITPKQAALTQLDERTNKFFQKVMTPVNAGITQLPSLPPFFQKLGEYPAINDPDIGNKLVRGIALPHVKNLMVEFDRESPTIVNDLIGA